MNSKKIEKNIKETESHLADLQERFEKTTRDLEQVKDQLSKDWDNSKVRSSMQAFQSDKSFLEDEIRDTQDNLMALREELDAARAQEQREEIINKLVGLANQATKSEQEYIKLYEKLDSILVKEIPKIVTALGEWSQSSKEFARLANQVGGVQGVSPEISESADLDSVLSRRVYDGEDARSKYIHPEVLWQFFITSMEEEWNNPGSVFRQKLSEYGHQDHVQSKNWRKKIKNLLKTG